MTKSRFNLKKVMMLTAGLVIVMTSAFGQRRECPLAKYNGNWAYGTTETFYVGDPFDGIGQIEVMRPGKRAQIHEKNRKWKLDGVPIRPGQVFTKAGDFTMTIESNGFETAYKVQILPAKGPQRPVATVLSYPIQTEYKVGDHFYVDGIKVECRDADGKELPVETKDITFFTSVSNTLVGAGHQCGGGYKFSTAGRKVIEVRYKWVTIGKYTINVIDRKPSTDDGKPSVSSSKPSVASNKPRPATENTKSVANGWYNLRAMNNYLNLDASGAAELRKKAENLTFYAEDKGNNQVTLKMANGRYLGIAGAFKNGVRIKAVSDPYLWKIYSENNADIYSLRPSDNTQMVMNASGQKNADGTHVILWSYENFNAPNHAEFRFMPANVPKK